MSAPGFTVTGFYCQHPSCTERADGIAENNGGAKGLPVGWVEVDVKTYAKSMGITSAFMHVLTRHYCSVAHLPLELLPDDAP